MADRARTDTGRVLRDLSVAVLVYAAYGLFAILPLDAASALGGLIGRTLGPRLGVSRRAVRNLSNAFPDANRREIAAIVKAMWESLCRNAAEAPHLSRIVRDIGQPGARVSVIGLDNVEAIPEGKPVIFFSGHLANWEVMSRGMAALGFPFAPVFRDPNNPYVSRLLRHIRHYPGIELVPKGAAGARLALAVLSGGRRLGMLIDQKMNDGIPVPFFGRDAMTAPAAAQFALRFDCPIVPLRLERMNGPRFRLTIGAPLDLPDGDDRQGRIAAIMVDVNGILEGWIRERPAEWLWLHNRWPD